MKAIFSIIVFLICAASSLAQLPVKIFTINPYSLKVSDKFTTVLIFPYEVLDADHGVNNLWAEKIPGLPNILKIKAGSPTMDTTSLHVFTADGQVYPFEISYAAFPQTITINITGKNESSPIGPVQLKNGINIKGMEDLMDKARKEGNFLNTSKRRYKMTLTLTGIFFHDETIILKFSIKNRSQLPFQTGWSSIYIEDKKISKRSSDQQLQLPPIYSGLSPMIKGKISEEWIIAINKITIPDKKRMTIQIMEQNGGRQLTLYISNKQIFKAKSI